MPVVSVLADGTPLPQIEMLPASNAALKMQAVHVTLARMKAGSLSQFN